MLMPAAEPVEGDPEPCEPVAFDHKACYEGDVFWFDSCGTPSDFVETCGEGSCVGGACVDGCVAVEGARACDGDKAVAVDSCGELGEVIEVCEHGTGCEDGFCVEECIVESAPDAYVKLANYSACVNELCDPNATNSPVCPLGAALACGPEASACGGLTPAGGSGCLPLVNCVLGCSDSSCIFDCFSNGSSEDVELASDYMECVFDACGPLLKQECWASAEAGGCKSALNACLD